MGTVRKFSDFSEDAEFAIGKLETLRLSSFVNVSVRHEYVDFERRLRLGGSDAMILNFLECSRVPFVLSCDFDLAYAALRGDISKTVLIPDDLFRRRMHGLN